MKIALLLLVLAGCGGPQGAISGQAEVHVATQAARFELYADEDGRCGSLHPGDREAYRRCMEPTRAIARAADTYRELLEVAQHLVDVGNEDGFTGALAEVIGAARHLARALAAAGVDVPSDVRDLIAMGE